MERVVYYLNHMIMFAQYNDCIFYMNNPMGVMSTRNSEQLLRCQTFSNYHMQGYRLETLISSLHVVGSVLCTSSIFFLILFERVTVLSFVLA